MKTKLLRKVRRNFRIVKNENGDSRIQERHFGAWEDLGLYEGFMAYKEYGGENVTHQDALLNVLKSRYSKYSRKLKIHRKKARTWTKIWYNEKVRPLTKM